MAPFPPRKSVAVDEGPTIHEQLDISLFPRPFKNPQYKPSSRRNKSLKQVLADASRAQVASLIAAQTASASANQSGATTPALNPNIQRATAAQQAAALQKLNLSAGGTNGGMEPTYTNIESQPSVKVKRHWCDVTGLRGRYTDPKTKLRYANGEVYGVLRELGPGVADQYLELRGANVVLK